MRSAEVRLATVRTGGGTAAARIDGDVAVELDAPDVGALLTLGGLDRAATAGGGVRHDMADVDLAPVIPHPGKIICVGLNYRAHIREMGRDIPVHPTLFAKFPEALIGPNDPIVLDGASQAVDWEAELAVVVGRRVRRADAGTARDAIAGFTVINDVTMRDWQFRTIEWTQGKIWEATAPVGPYVVTPDEVGGVRPALEVRTVVDGEVMQQDDTGTLLFDPVFLVKYISTLITLRPGDMIATGTPAGVGNARTPQVFLQPGQTVVTEIEGLGTCTNKVVEA